MKKEKLLIVSWGVYPMAAGSAIIVDNIARYFNHDEIVLVGEKASNLMEEKDNIRRANTYYVNPNIQLFGKGQRYFQWLNFNKLVKNIRHIAEKENCTAVLAIFPNEFYVYAAYRVSQQLNLPFYTWFHNTYVDSREGRFQFLNKRLQTKFFNAARINFVVSDGILNFYKQKYPDVRFQTLVHGFNIPDVEYSPFQSDQPVKRFLFSGGFSESCREATVRLIKTITQNPNYHVHIFTGTPLSIFENFGIRGDNVHYEGFVLFKTFVERFVEFDIMLLPHGFDGERTEAEFKTIFPTRTIPILYSNRPILAHTPKNVFLTDFLRQYNCAEIVDEKSGSAIHAAIEKLLNDEEHREKLIKNAIQTASLFDVKKISKQLRRAVFDQS